MIMILVFLHGVYRFTTMGKPQSLKQSKQSKQSMKQLKRTYGNIRKIDKIVEDDQC